jgi:hypothetical protein
MLSNTENIKEDKEVFEDEINVNIDKTKSSTSTQLSPQSSQCHV